MKVLVACEESQRVCTAFRERGHEAYSCDIEDCSGGHPEWHIQGDVLPILNGNCTFTTADGEVHSIDSKWDMIIAHPPCTYLSNVATRHHSLLWTPLEKIEDRTKKRIQAAEFFMQIATAECDRIVIENPVGIMNTLFRKPDQIIQPYQFAAGGVHDSEYVTKATGLWLKGVHPLIPNIREKPNNAVLFGKTPTGKNRTWEDTYSRDAKERSKTFLGIAKAMAEQWGGDFL